MEISYREILRYLKAGDVIDKERVSALIEELISVFETKIVPKSVYGIWDCHVNSRTVALDGMTVNSKSLAGHLAGCHKVVMLATTLGPEADMLIRRYSVQDMEKAVVAQAVCAAMIEAYCDKTGNEIAQKDEFSGLYPTERFSPGYGDFNITHQKEILKLLNCARIGLTLTSGYMLIPSKSVTALFGFTEDKKQIMGKCKQCTANQCEFREVM
ncbi:MAG: hypothetical protein LBQ89_00515 [Treponema sp.]|jgi:hypothetical protein|nr:hypothetical protein [Treponema sp.]